MYKFNVKNKFKNQVQKNSVLGLDFEMIKKMILGAETKENKNRYSVKNRTTTKSDFY